MVWALIIAFALFSPTLAYAEPEVVETEEVVQGDEGTEEGVTDDEVLQEPAEGDSESDVSAAEPVQASEDVEEVVTYSPDGEILSTTKAPEIVRAVSPTYTVYASVTSNTYSDMAARMLWKMGWGDDYVFWRSGQYSYTLAYGDFDLASGRFDCASAHVVTFTLDSGYSGTYTMTEGDGVVSLVPSSYIVYSNLGQYPLLDSGHVFERLVVFMSCVAVIMELVRTVFSFTLRMGVRVENEH